MTVNERPTEFMSYDQARERAGDKILIVCWWLLQWGWASFESIQQRLDLDRSGVYRTLARAEKEGYVIRDRGTLATRWRLTRRGRQLLGSEVLREKRQVSWSLAAHDDVVQIAAARLLRRIGGNQLEQEFLGTNSLALKYPSQTKKRRPDGLVFCAGVPIFLEYEHTRKSPDKRENMIEGICKMLEENHTGTTWLICKTEKMRDTYRRTCDDLQGRWMYQLSQLEVMTLDELDEHPLPDWGTGEEPEKEDALVAPVMPQARLKEKEVEIEALHRQVEQLKHREEHLQRIIKDLRSQQETHSKEKQELLNELREAKTRKKGFFGR